MVDNFDKILNIVDVDKYDDGFMTIRLISRNKDFENSYENPKFYKGFIIRSKKELEYKRDEIIMLCNKYNARAYINPSIKSLRNLTATLAVRLVTDISTGAIVNPYNIVDSIAGDIPGFVKRFVVDIDKDDMENLHNIKSYVKSLLEEMSCVYPDKLCLEIPTKTGIHLITDPFDCSKFKYEYPFIEIHKNSAGALLYSA